MVTRQSLEQELHQAMRSGDELRKRTVRMALSAIKLAEVEARGPLDQAALMGVLRKEIKTRLESIPTPRSPAGPIWSSRPNRNWSCWRAICHPPWARPNWSNLRGRRSPRPGPLPRGSSGQ
jgi:hypothetical protein